MLRSMTAFGRARRMSTDNALDITAEIKSVNSRYLDCSVRISRMYSFLEEKVKAYLSEAGITRGKVEVYIGVDVLEQRGAEVMLDAEAAKSYIAALEKLRDTFDLKDDISVMSVAANRDLFVMKKPDDDIENDWREIKAVLAEAVESYNKMRAAWCEVTPNEGVSSSQLMELIESLELPKGYIVEWGPVQLQEKENEGRLMWLLVAAFVFAYLFLVAQYESWTIPIPVMLSVFFALLGALIGLWVTKTPLSIYAQLGCVMLIGLAAKNAILMVEFSKQERESGKGIFEAAISGADLRYRAVMMTAWSFVIGVLPLVFAVGAGSGAMKAIGICTFSGMLFASVVGIVFVPALYSLFQRLREKMTGLFKRGAKN